MKKLLSLLVFVGLLTIKTAAQYQYPFLNPTLSYQERVEDLISLLTREENYLSPSIAPIMTYLTSWTIA